MRPISSINITHVLGLLPHLLQPQVGAENEHEAASDDLEIDLLLHSVLGDGVQVQEQTDDGRGTRQRPQNSPGPDQIRLLSGEKPRGLFNEFICCCMCGIILSIQAVQLKLFTHIN